MEELRKVSKKVYCDYSSGNYGVHALMFTDPQGNSFYYSEDYVDLSPERTNQ